MVLLTTEKKRRNIVNLVLPEYSYLLILNIFLVCN